MAITRAQLAKELEPGLNALFGLEYDRYDQEHAEIFDEETSDRAFEKAGDLHSALYARNYCSSILDYRRSYRR